MLHRMIRSKTSLTLLVILGLALWLVFMFARATAVTNVFTSTKTDFKLGEKVVLDATVALSASDSLSSYMASFEITGPQPVSPISLSNTPGTYEFNTDTPSADKELKVTIQFFPPSATVPGTLPGTLPSPSSQFKYKFEWKPKVALDPAPAGLSTGTLQTPQFINFVPGGGAGGGTGGGLPKFPNAQFKFPLPFVPGTDTPATPKGMADAGGNNLFVLLDGSPNDKIVKVNKDTGFIEGDFQGFSVGTNKAEGVTSVTISGTTKLLVVESDSKNIRVMGTDGASATDTTDDLKGTCSGTPPVCTGLLSFDKPGGIAYDSGASKLYVTEKVSNFGDDIHVDVISLTSFTSPSPTLLNTFTISTFAVGQAGFGDMAFQTNTMELLAGTASQVSFINTDFGFVTFNSGVFGGPADIQAMAFKSDVLYLADSSGIYASDREPAAAGAKPVGLADDGATDLFILLDGGASNDTIKRVHASSPNVAVGSTITLGTTGAESLAYLNGFLYYVDNSAGPAVVKLNPTTGEITSQTMGTGIEIGGLTKANVGGSTVLLAFGRFYDTFWNINPSTLAITGAPKNITSAGGGGPPKFPLGGYEGAGAPDSGEIITSRFGGFAIINASDGKVQENANVMGVTPGDKPTPYNITGLTVIGQTLYMVDADAQAVYAASKPGATPPSLLINGSYTAKLTVTTNPSLLATKDFTISKVTPPTINITSPADGSAVVAANLDAQGKITVVGNVNDPSMEGASVTIGVVIPDQELFKDPVNDTSPSVAKWSNAGLWHLTDLTDNAPIKMYPSAPDKLAWWYGQEGTGNYETGTANSGGLQVVGNINILGTDTKLTFWTWWNTEFGTGSDKKLVQVSTDGGATWENVAQIKEPEFGGFGGGGGGGSCGAKCTFVTVEPGPFGLFGPFGESADKGWKLVEVSLKDFLGSNRQIRFFFDTIDPGANFFEGWFIDNVKIAGQSAAGETTTILADLTFTGKFAPSEGENTISATATRSAYDSTTISKSVKVFLDNTAPVFTLNAVTSPTGTSSQALTGTIKDPTADQIIVKLTNTGAGITTPLTVGLDKAPPTDGNWSITTSLFEGINSITAEASDKGGNKTTRTATIILDTTAPTVTLLSTKYPVGEVAGRPGDLVVFQVKAEDTGSGVANVKVDLPGSSLVSFLARSAIPDFFLKQWGIADTATHVLPTNLPSLLSPGTSYFTLTATDNASKTTTLTGTSSVSAVIVASLTKFNIYLLPGWNLVSTPLTLTNDNWSSLIPAPGTDATTKLDDAVDIVWYYDAEIAKTSPSTAWVFFTPATGDTDTLTKIKPGRGYWIHTCDTSPCVGTQFGAESEVATGVSVRPPIKMTVTGTFLPPGAQQVPPSTKVFKGWNVIGFHSENNKLVSQGLRSLTVPTQIWGSLLQFDYFVEYKGAGQTPEARLGTFTGLDEASTMKPGRGFWVFMQADGEIVPTN